MQRIIELVNKISSQNAIFDSINKSDPDQNLIPNNNIDYSLAHEIPEINPSESKKKSALDRAWNAMNLNKDMPGCF